MGRDELRADCARCVGLCCVATAFERSDDFAFTKPMDEPCRHLGADHACGVHGARSALGLGGCAAYDCWGAGQRATRAWLGGGDWRGRPDAVTVFAAFRVLRELHELLAILDLARGYVDVRSLAEAAARIDTLADRSAEALAAYDVAPERRVVRRLLAELRAGGALPIRR